MTDTTGLPESGDLTMSEIPNTNDADTGRGIAVDCYLELTDGVKPDAVAVSYADALADCIEDSSPEESRISMPLS